MKYKNQGELNLKEYHSTFIFYSNERERDREVATGSRTRKVGEITIPRTEKIRNWQVHELEVKIQELELKRLEAKTKHIKLYYTQRRDIIKIETHFLGI